jgi:hypothetical protein
LLQLISVKEEANLANGQGCVAAELGQTAVGVETGDGAKRNVWIKMNQDTKGE